MGYHIDQALIAVGSGGLTGKGLGQSIQAFGYLPEAANDSIFAILAEIFGFLGTIAVLAIFAALLYRLVYIVDRSANIYYRMLVAGVFGWVFSHTVVNIGAMLGIFPLTGITLPFVSFGGTSLLFMLAALGLTLQISRYTGHQTLPGDNLGGSNEDRRRGRGVGRPRDAKLGNIS
jgi:cell division protein FtsW